MGRRPLPAGKDQKGEKRKHEREREKRAKKFSAKKESEVLGKKKNTHPSCRRRGRPRRRQGLRPRGAGW